MIYLASPYSHPDPRVRQERFMAARTFTLFHMRAGKTIISPVVYGHQFAVNFGMPITYEFWAKLNENLLIAADQMWVLMLEGWKESEGIKHEISYADTSFIPVEFKEPLV